MREVGLLLAKDRQAQIQHLWVEWKGGAPQAREEIILICLPWVKTVAGRLSVGIRGGLDREDLLGHGVLGLMDALDRYDPSRKVPFYAFALPRIRGAMVDALRSLDWVPRSVRQWGKELSGAYAVLENRLGRSAGDEEVREYLGWDEERFTQALMGAEATWLSLEEAIGDGLALADGIADPRAANPPSLLASQISREVLTGGIEALPEKERLVVFLYYYEELTLREIAEVIGVSESRVSQMHTKAVLRLRGRLGRRKQDLISEREDLHEHQIT